MLILISPLDSCEAAFSKMAFPFMDFMLFMVRSS